MAEMFTLRRLKLSPSLYKCLATTNLIESPRSGVARRKVGSGRVGCSGNHCVQIPSAPDAPPVAVAEVAGRS